MPLPFGLVFGGFPLPILPLPPGKHGQGSLLPPGALAGTPAAWPGHGGKVYCCPNTAVLPHTAAGKDTRLWEDSQGRAVSCRLLAQLNTSHILQSQNKAPSPSVLQLLTVWTSLLPPSTNTAWIWASSSHAHLFFPPKHSASLLCRLENPLLQQLPCSLPLRSLWQLTWEHTYLLPADLYISNACKLSPAANRPSLLILTSEGAWLYFSINSPSTFSFPSHAPLFPKWRHPLFKLTCYQ